MSYLRQSYLKNVSVIKCWKIKKRKLQSIVYLKSMSYAFYVNTTAFTALEFSVFFQFTVIQFL